MKRRQNKAFTLIEILIVVVILGILAAIVIPQFTNASTDAQRGNIQSQLQTIRSQIQLFRVKNSGATPELITGGDFVDLVSGSAATPYTNTAGNKQTEPYLRVAPGNPRVPGNNSTKVAASGTPAATATATDPTTATSGWLYNKATGDIAAVGFNDTNNKWFGEP